MGENAIFNPMTRIPSGLFPLLTAILTTISCGKIPSKAGSLAPLTYRHNSQTKKAWRSIPAKQVPGNPLVILLTPDLKFNKYRETAVGKKSFLTIFDHYLNNAGVSLLRLGQTNRQATGIDAALKEADTLLRTIRNKNHSRKLLLITFGSAAPLGLLLAKKHPGLPVILIGPPMREYRRIIRWRLLEEPNRDFASCFDMDGDGRVTAAEFRRDTYRVRKEKFPKILFKDLDRDGDGSVTEADFNRINRKKFIRLDRLLLEKNSSVTGRSFPSGESGRWIASIYRFTTRKHLESLLKRGRNRLSILHGSMDRRIPASESRSLLPVQDNNLSVQITGGEDHELNWSEYHRRGRLPRGMMQLFREIFSLLAIHDTR